MEITKKDVALAAKLAKMHVSEQEADVYQAQLESLFKFVAGLSSVKTESVSLTHAIEAAHTRADEPKTDLALAAELRAQFDQEQDGCAKVKKVL